MINKTYVGILLSIFLLIPLSLHAEIKIGYVVVEKVLKDAPQTASSNKKLEKEFATRDRDLVAAQKALKDVEDKLSKDGAIMSESERTRLERDIINKRRDLKRNTTEFQEDVNFRRNEEMGKIQQLIAEAIVELAKAKGYDLVLGTGAVYASGKVDVTKQIIDLLKARK